MLLRTHQALQALLEFLASTPCFHLLMIVHVTAEAK